MHELLIFCPGSILKTSADLIAAGLGEFADPNHQAVDAGVTFFPGFDGPSRKYPADGEVGTLVVVSGPGEHARSAPPKLDRERQTWTCSANEYDRADDAAWFGWETAFPPTPAVLDRRTQYVGPLVTLGGRDWFAPLYLLLPLTLAQHSSDTTPAAARATSADRLAFRLARDLRVFLKDPRNANHVEPGQPAAPGARALVEHALSRNYRGNWMLWKAMGLLADDLAVTTAMLAITGITGLTQQHRGEL